jgi:regulatory protein YycI of two-component signal transduction system YycFG
MMTVYIKTNSGFIEEVSSIEKQGYVPMKCLDDDFFQFWSFYKIEKDYVVFDIETYFKPNQEDILVFKREDNKYIAYKAKVEHRDVIPYSAEDSSHDDIMLHINDYYDVDEDARTITLNQQKKDDYAIYMEYKRLVKYLQDTDWVVIKKYELGEERHPDIVQKREETRVRINEIQEEIDINLFL